MNNLAKFLSRSYIAQKAVVKIVWKSIALFAIITNGDNKSHNLNRREGERLQRVPSISADDKQLILSEVLPGGLVSYELFSEKNESGKPVYGIEIKSELSYDTGSISLSDITEDESLARELFERVVAYIVTPCELVYVAEDLIWEKYSA